MTVTYSLEVSQARLCGFAKLLLKWKGSIYKLMYREMFIFAILYYGVALLYRVVLQEGQQRKVFEDIAVYCREFTDSVPMTFVMGFFVAMVVGRWWQMFMAIPWIDRCAVQIAAFVQGADEKGRLIRRSLVRYLNLIWVLTFQATSTVIKKRFPTRDHLVESGLMTVEEKMVLEEASSPHGDWFIPASWFANLAMEARKEGRIHDDLHLKSIMDEMLAFRGSCGMVYGFDWISIPLVYTQVVTIVVYSFFAACLMGRQWLYSSAASESLMVDKYVPVFTLFQFFFYFGWLKVAEVMICPFGEDDDDFELNFVLDRNVQVSFMLVDDFYRKHPKLMQDQFWNDLEPEIPYTEAARSFKMDPYLGSTFSMNVASKGMEWQVHEPIAEEADALRHRDAESGSVRRHSPATNSFRPKFLNVLLAGDSRLSLASRFGSKNSLMSGKSPRSPGRSPPLARKQRSAPHGHGHRLGSKSSMTRFHRPSETAETIASGIEGVESRPISVLGNLRSDSRLASLVTLEDTSGTDFFPLHAGNSPADKGGSSADAGAGHEEGNTGDTSPLLLQEHEISWPRETSSSSGGCGSGGMGNEPGFLEQVNVPPPLTEVPEPEAEGSGQDLESAGEEKMGAEEAGEEGGNTEQEGGKTADIHAGVSDKESEDGSSTDNEQKTVTSLTQLIPKGNKS